METIKGNITRYGDSGLLEINELTEYNLFFTIHGDDFGVETESCELISKEDYLHMRARIDKFFGVESK